MEAWAELVRTRDIDGILSKHASELLLLHVLLRLNHTGSKHTGSLIQQFFRRLVIVAAGKLPHSKVSYFFPAAVTECSRPTSPS
jgi:hypothetical protein